MILAVAWAALAALIAKAATLLGPFNPYRRRSKP